GCASGRGRLLHRPRQGGDDHRVVRVDRPRLLPIPRAPRRRGADRGRMAHPRPARRRTDCVRGSRRPGTAVQGPPGARMTLLSYDGGFGRVEDGAVVPMGDDLVRFLATGRVQTGTAVPLASVRIRAPVPRPGKVICVGLNYRDHAEESGQPIPDEPVLFAKFANSVTGPGTPIAVPPAVQQPDYEAELGV